MRVRNGLIVLLMLIVGWQLGWGQFEKVRTPPPNTSPYALVAPYAPGELVVGLESADSVLPIWAMEMVGTITSVNTAIHSYVVRLAPGITLESAAAFLSAFPDVRYVEPNYFVFTLAEPNDPYFSQQYGPTRIQAHLAWDIWRPRRTVYIAVIDTGIDYHHPDLTNKMRRHANGEVYGYNALNNAGNALDDHRHGTIVAGVAAAEINNGVGIAGVAAWNPSVHDANAYVQLMPVKTIDSNGIGTIVAVTNGIIWATDNGAHILNMSIRSPLSQHLEDAVNYAWNRGCLVVAAAGNDGASQAVYPAYYVNCIAVAATDSNDRLAHFSQWGSWVDIAAPGVGILSTIPNNRYASYDGTSMACPHVAGAAAVVWSHEPSLTNAQLRTALETNVDPYQPYSGRTLAPGAGRVNVYRALQAIDDLPKRPQITWLGTLGQSSVARGVSDFGNVVVGWFTTSDGKNFAFRWTRSAGMQNLGTFPQYITSEAYGVSADGNRVAGVSHNVASAWKAFLWTPENGLQDLGSLGGNRSLAHGISADGSVLVGRSNDLSGRMYAFRWTQSNGMQSLGTLGGSDSRAFGVSRNGSVIVGRSHNHLGEIWAFVWRNPAQGMQGLSPLAACCGEAYGVSDDGLVIAGRAHSATTERWHACLWTWNGSDYSPRDLGTLGGNESQALACTNNPIAVGWSHNAAGQRRAFRWTQARGMEDLTMTYARLLSPGSYLEVAYDITPDGRFIVGQGYNAATGRQEAFLLHTLCIGHNGDADANGCVDDADLLAVLFAFGNSGEVLGGVDTNCDGVVDDADLLQVLFNFGSGC